MDMQGFDWTGLTKEMYEKARPNEIMGTVAVGELRFDEVYIDAEGDSICIDSPSLPLPPDGFKESEDYPPIFDIDEEAGRVLLCGGNAAVGSRGQDGKKIPYEDFQRRVEAEIRSEYLENYHVKEALPVEEREKAVKRWEQAEGGTVRKMNESRMQEELYGIYQLDWMISHGHSLHDLYHELHEAEKEYETPNIGEIWADFEDHGFDGELFACFDEFCDTELRNESFIQGLLDTIPVHRKEELEPVYQEWLKNTREAEKEPEVSESMENPYILGPTDEKGIIPEAIVVQGVDPFITDFEASRLAEKNGVKFINDIKGLEKGLYIDTPENRKIVERAIAKDKKGEFLFRRDETPKYYLEQYDAYVKRLGKIKEKDAQKAGSAR